MSQADDNPEYWDEYSNLQHVKHELIRHYLNGWFPKMTLGSTGTRRLLYIDTHAGRGKHLTGELGSPLVALTTLLNHRSRNQILQNCEVTFYFIERDESNLAALRRELAGHSPPKNVIVDPQTGDCFQEIESALAATEGKGRKIAPSFFFVDPYGFKLPGHLLQKLMSHPQVELFVNVIWRELDMAMQQVRGVARPQRPQNEVNLFSNHLDPPKAETAVRRPPASRASLEATLKSVFNGDDWRKIDSEDDDERADQCADLFRQITGARWGTYLRMLDNGRVRYFLLHLTNHDAGRDLMKDSMWKACPDGGFYASKADNPRQQTLIVPEPDLRPLHDWVATRLANGPKRWQVLVDELRDEVWLPKHLNEVIRLMKKAAKIVPEQFTGHFALTNNPVLRLAIQQQLR